MGLKKLAVKIAEYNERLESGQASKIKPGHVEKILRKLKKKTDDLSEEISQTSLPEKKARLEKKLEIAKEHVDRATWLLKEIG